MNLHSVKLHLILIFAGLFIGGCSNDSKLVAHLPAGGGLTSLSLHSSAFKGGEMIPSEFTADGKDISPPLKWSLGPAQTQEFVLFVEDPDAPGKVPFVQWIVYGMPANETSLPPGASSAMGGTATVGNMIQGANSKGQNSYSGPEPEPGKLHRYYFELFAIDKSINLPAGSTKDQVVAAMNGHVLTKGILMGTYQR